MTTRKDPSPLTLIRFGDARLARRVRWARAPCARIAGRRQPHAFSSAQRLPLQRKPSRAVPDRRGTARACSHASTATPLGRHTGSATCRHHATTPTKTADGDQERPFLGRPLGPSDRALPKIDDSDDCRRFFLRSQAARTSRARRSRRSWASRFGAIREGKLWATLARAPARGGDGRSACRAGARADSRRASSFGSRRPQTRDGCQRCAGRDVAWFGNVAAGPSSADLTVTSWRSRARTAARVRRSRAAVPLRYAQAVDADRRGASRGRAGVARSCRCHASLRCGRDRRTSRLRDPRDRGHMPHR